LTDEKPSTGDNSQHHKDNDPNRWRRSTVGIIYVINLHDAYSVFPHLKNHALPTQVHENTLTMSITAHIAGYALPKARPTR
jgi:hypothetical protein